MAKKEWPPLEGADDDLITAAVGRDLDGVKAAIARGANVDARTSQGLTALHFAALRGNTEMVKTLLSAGADIYATGNLRETAVSMAGDHKETLAELNSHFDKLREANRPARTPEEEQHDALIAAAYDGDGDAVRTLVASGVNVNRRRKDGMTALHYAAMGGHLETVRELITLRANVNAKTRSRLSPLIFAAIDNHAAVAAELLNAGADVDYRGADGKTALESAEECGSTETVQTILRYLKTKKEETGWER